MMKREKAIRVWTILSVCALGLYTTACDRGEFGDEEKDPANVELRFAASISDSPSARTASGADMIAGANFPDGTHTFGMFITDDGGIPLATGSDDNMKSILVRGSGSDVWTHADKSDAPLSLKAKLGDNVNITGYYPWVEGATATAVPFDLTGEATTWQDLLYLSLPTTAQEVSDATPIALQFSHAYCWVTVNLSKLTVKNDVKVTAISIDNSYGGVAGKIINEGNLNPKTGEITGTSFGALTINCNPAINIPVEGTASTPSVFNFLVPSFMSADVKDSDIVFRVITELTGSTTGETEILSFPLETKHLNNANTNQYGFQKGMHNTYNVVYNNSEMVLSLSDWKEVAITENSLGGGMAGISPFTITYSHQGVAQQNELAKLTTGTHINHTYLGEVVDGNNGVYREIEPVTDGGTFGAWKPFMTTEPFYTRLHVAKKDALGGATVPWKDEKTGALMAKQVCAQLREGGYSDWRLPRISELFMLIYAVPQQINLNLVEEYWSATEHSATESYSVYFNKTISQSRVPRYLPKNVGLYVRCVRDADKPKPTL